jgi:hypothetical protein
LTAIKEVSVNVITFTACENVLTNKCSGEVAVLIRVAERYGILMEKARERVEEICRHCENHSSLEKNSIGHPKKLVA